MNNQLQIDYDLYYKQNNFSDLKRAVTTLTTVTEQQFKVIKNEKWYTRLFDCVTFSNKKNKRIALQIKSLAQAQSVLAEMLILLSERDKQVLELLCQNTNDIQELSKICGFLANKIQYLQNSIAFGIHTAEDINELSEIGKQTLSGCLYKLNLMYNGKSSIKQKEYADCIFKVIKCEAKLDNLEVILETLEEKDRRLILTCCLEYIFLRKNKFKISRKLIQLIRKFDIGEKTYEQIKDNIISTYKLCGENRFIDKVSQISVDESNQNEIVVHDITDDLVEYEIAENIEIENINNKNGSLSFFDTLMQAFSKIGNADNIRAAIESNSKKNETKEIEPLVKKD